MKKRLLSTLLILMLCLSLCLTVAASSDMELISAYLNYGITIEFNGDVQRMYDVTGKQVYPISYQGTTYLPIRAVGNMLGLPVDWDGANNKVILGVPEEGIDFINTFTPYSHSVINSYYDSFDHVQSSAHEMASFAGYNVDHWILLDNSKFYDPPKVYGYYNIGGIGDSLTFDVYSDYTFTLNIYGDNDYLIDSIEVIANQLPKTHTVNIANMSQLRISMDVNRHTVKAYIFNAVIQ